MTKVILTGSRVFDGEAIAAGRSVVIENGKIVDIVPDDKTTIAGDRIELKGGLLAPGFIDVQVNGGGGALFNKSADVRAIRQMAEAHRRYGTTGMLPTLITDSCEVMDHAMEAVAQARRELIPGILGIHIEGPFIDLARKGAHDERHIREMSPEDIEMILKADCGVILITVAPNRVDPQVIHRLSSMGVVVSLGHSDAAYETVQVAIDAGARSFTHLFNAMSQLRGREPGMVGAALASPDAYVGIIPDGFHVHPVSLRLALKAKGWERFVVVTDAMSSAAGGRNEFELQGRKVRLKNGRLQLGNGTLAGSNLTMIEAVRYCIQELDLTVEQALAMASRVPAEMLKLDDVYGRIAPGYAANLVHLDDEMNVQQTWIDGK